MAKQESAPQTGKKTPIDLAKLHKAQIIEQFSPVFCFAADEYIFPTSAEEYSEDVLRAKMKHYERLEGQGKKLNKDEVEQYKIIKENFFGGKDSAGPFDIEGFKKSAVKGYVDYEALVDSGHTSRRKVDDLLTFNEKRHGYALGSQVPIKGHAPKGKKVDAPAYVSYVPTEDGAIIRYECFYSLSGAIPGTNWLYKLLPEKVSKAFGDFAVHAGDWEGVYIKVKIDDNGKTTLDHMQTFAHGRSGARKVDASQLSFKDGSPCVYVGSATHPSYADNFAGRNKFVDTVGDAYTLKPKKFVDLSPDVPKPSWTACKLWGRADIMTSKSDYVKSGQEYAEKQTKQDWLKYDYHPVSENRVIRFLKHTVRQISNFAAKVVGATPPAPSKPVILDLHMSQIRGVLPKHVAPKLSKANEREVPSVQRASPAAAAKKQAHGRPARQPGGGVNPELLKRIQGIKGIAQSRNSQPSLPPRPPARNKGDEGRGL